MADPIIPNVWRVQSVLQGSTDLPRDRFVNSLAFVQDNQGTHAGMADELATIFEVFWTATHPGGTGALASHIAGWVTGASIRVYDLRTGPPRAPEVRALAVNFTATTGLPSEVALASSLVCTRNIPRQRGRFYLGPLANTGSVIDSGSATDDARPNSVVMNNLVAATQYLAGPHTPTVEPVGDLRLAVISQVDQIEKLVTGGWVDNAFDTQRRRGIDPNDRTTWGTFTA